MSKSIAKVSKRGTPGIKLGFIEEQVEIDLRYLKSVPDTPDGFSDAECKLWRETAETMILRGTLTEADLPTLEQYVRAVAAAREIRTTLATTGHFYTNQNGNPVQHPLSYVLRAEEQAIRNFGTSLQLTPRSRGVTRKTKDQTSQVSAKQIGEEF